MVKKIYLLCLVFIVTSCAEDIKFNSPAFQGLKDNVFWRARSYSAYTNTNGYLIIEGQLGLEKVILQLPDPTPQTYILGVDNIKKASFSNVTLSSETPNFTTGTKKGNGQVVITEYNTEEKTISGTFKFTAINTNEDDLEKPKITFTEGVFYKIKYTPTSNL